VGDWPGWPFTDQVGEDRAPLVTLTRNVANAVRLAGESLPELPAILQIPAGGTSAANDRCYGGCGESNSPRLTENAKRDVEATMRIDTLENLFIEEIQDIRSVERQILDALTRIAHGVSPRGLWQSLVQLRESTERCAARLRRELVQPASRTGDALSPKLARLTAREVEVLERIAEGYANKQIAAGLGISIKTVEKHRQNLMAKLDLHDTAGVTRYAISAGVVEASAP
jgi:DNA-binding CsgD family transcriptional regulator